MILTESPIINSFKALSPLLFYGAEFAFWKAGDGTAFEHLDVYNNSEVRVQSDHVAPIS